MPWETQVFNQLVSREKDVIKTIFGVRPTVDVLMCTQKELSEKLVFEINKMNLPDHLRQFHLKYSAKNTIGKYFREEKEIWIVEEFSDRYYLIIHELLHTIQKCRPNRENIVDYLSFLISNDSRAISEELLLEWNVIEKNYGKKQIIRQFLTNSDCEDFH